ncbi:hypothetical protein EVJ24_04905 [Exiguobacterium sp. SH1S21]|nr:hypothetical protein EVJ24_04905 [Exiguobacterium sp. SH1S21]
MLCKRPPDGDRLRCSSDDAPTPAGMQSDGDQAATRVATRLRDCLRKAWAPEGRAISIMLVNKLRAKALLFNTNVYGYSPERIHDHRRSST